jgi:hypothetical protein
MASDAAAGNRRSGCGLRLSLCLWMAAAGLMTNVAQAGLEGSPPAAYEGVVTCMDTNRHEMTVYGGNSNSRQRRKLPAHATFTLRVIPDVKRSDNRKADLKDIRWGTRVSLTYSKQSADRYAAKTIRLVGSDPAAAGLVSCEKEFNGKPAADKK